MTTLVTKGGEIRVEGIMSRIVVIDTGASAVILGRSFAQQFEQYQHPNLDYGATFITASGRKDRALGRITHPISFVLASGTTHCEGCNDVGLQLIWYASSSHHLISNHLLQLAREDIDGSRIRPLRHVGVDDGLECNGEV